MNKKYDYVVFIGRMQPPHKAHIEIINKAFDYSENVIILVGSANSPRTIKNPWTWKEREEMIRACFPADKQENIIVFGISDTYNDQTWVRSVQDQIDYVVRADRLIDKTVDVTDVNIGLIGHAKDDSSYYLKMFPQWKFIGVDNIDDINSSDIRERMFAIRDVEDAKLPEGISNFIGAFMNSEAYENLEAEYFHIKEYHKAWGRAPYAPTFVTVDAIVVQSGHVLLVRRRSAPGKGLWALPGGFVNQNERIEDAVIRELKEETKLKVPVPVLKGNIKSSKVFDDPNRSLRGRTITHAHYIELEPGELPKVKGSDDADKARWVPLGVFEKMQDQMFEDHWHIVNYFVGG